MPHLLKRLGSLTPRCRKVDTVVPFTAESTDTANSPPPKAGAGDEIRCRSPTAKIRGTPKEAFGSPVGSAKKPRLCQSEENPHMIAATPTSNSKKQRLSDDRGEGLGGFLGCASPMSNSSKKPRLSPLNHTPRVAMSPPQNTNRRLYDQSPTLGAKTPAESPPVPAESPPPPAMNSGMRHSAATPCRPPVLPPNVGELPALNLQGLNGTPSRSTSAPENLQQPHRRQLEFGNTDLPEETKDPFDVRASCPAALLAAPVTASTASPPKAESQPKRPQTARPPARPLSGFLSGVVGRLMSPRRMMSPARVNSPRRDPLPPPVNASAPESSRDPVGQTSQGGSSSSSKRPSRSWFPSPRRREPTSSKPVVEVGKEGGSSAVQTPRGHKPDLRKHEVAAVAVDPVEALVSPMLSAVYGRALSSDEIAAATTACPEITWLAQCAILCPLPVGWVAVPAEEATGAPALYACELTGEIAEQPPHLPRFSKLARLLMHAVTHPTEAHTAVAWLKVEIDDALAECTRLQESWCRSVDPSSGSEFWHNPMTGKSSWESPAAPSAFAAAVAERVLDTEPFKAVRAREVAQGSVGSLTPRPPQESRAKSQAPSSRQRAGLDHRSQDHRSQQASMSSSRSYHTESYDRHEETAVQSARRRSSHDHRSKQTPLSARCERSDARYNEETPCRSRTSHDQRSRHTPSSARGRRGEIFDLYEDAPMRSSRRKDPVDHRSKQARTQASRGEVFDLFEETPTPSSRRRSQRAKTQRHRETSSSEEDEESADPEVYNMATPPRKEPPPQANPDVVTALAGAAAALATAATALSARGPQKDPIDTSIKPITTAITALNMASNASSSSMERQRKVIPEVSIACEDTLTRQISPKAPETKRVLQFPEVQSAPSISTSSTVRDAPPQESRDEQVDPTLTPAVKLAPPPPPPPPKPRNKAPAPPPPTEMPQGGLEAAIVSAERHLSASSESEGEAERKKVLSEVDTIIASARSVKVDDKPKAECENPPSVPSMLDQAKPTTAKVEPHEELHTTCDQSKPEDDKKQSTCDESKPEDCKKMNPLPKLKLPTGISPGVAAKGKSIPGMPGVIASSGGS